MPWPPEYGHGIYSSFKIRLLLVKKLTYTLLVVFKLVILANMFLEKNTQL